MKKLFTLLLLVSVLSGCSSQVQVITPVHMPLSKQEQVKSEEDPKIGLIREICSSANAKVLFKNVSMLCIFY